MKTILASTIALLLGAITLTAADKDKDKAVKPYPANLKTCVVSGDTLGEMGKQVPQYLGIVESGAAENTVHLT